MIELQVVSLIVGALFGAAVCDCLPQAAEEKAAQESHP